MGCSHGPPQPVQRTVVVGTAGLLQNQSSDLWGWGSVPVVPGLHRGQEGGHPTTWKGPLSFALPVPLTALGSGSAGLAGLLWGQLAVTRKASESWGSVCFSRSGSATLSSPRIDEPPLDLPPCVHPALVCVLLTWGVAWLPYLWAGAVALCIRDSWGQTHTGPQGTHVLIDSFLLDTR